MLLSSKFVALAHSFMRWIWFDENAAMYKSQWLNTMSQGADAKHTSHHPTTSRAMCTSASRNHGENKMKRNWMRATASGRVMTHSAKRMTAVCISLLSSPLIMHHYTNWSNSNPVGAIPFGGGFGIWIGFSFSAIFDDVVDTFIDIRCPSHHHWRRRHRFVVTFFANGCHCHDRCHCSRRVYLMFKLKTVGAFFRSFFVLLSTVLILSFCYA